MLRFFTVTALAAALFAVSATHASAQDDAPAVDVSAEHVAQAAVEVEADESTDDTEDRPNVVDFRAPMERGYSLGPRRQRWARGLSASGVGVLYALLWTYNYFAWWHNAELTPFQTEWDGWWAVDTYGGGADKLGHLLINAVLSRATSGILRYGQWSDRGATIAGATLSWLSYLFVELRDGAHEFEFSWGDLLANTLGVGLGVLLDHAPRFNQFFSFRMQYWPSRDFRESPSVNFNEDYSGQTFLVAFHLAGFGDKVGFFRYLDLVVGFNARNYLPNPRRAGAVEHQNLFIGFALNLQEVFRMLFFRRPRSQDTRGQELARGLFHDWATEHFQLPFTSAPIIQMRRYNR